MGESPPPFVGHGDGHPRDMTLVTAGLNGIGGVLGTDERPRQPPHPHHQRCGVLFVQVPLLTETSIAKRYSPVCAARLEVA